MFSSPSPADCTISLIKLTSSHVQVQVAAAATALSTLAVTVAPAAQAAQEAFLLADVSVVCCFVC